MTFEVAFKNLMTFEGGSTFHKIPGDSGGATKYGISLRALQGMGTIGDIDGDGDIDENDIKAMSEEEAMEIFRTQYWEPCKCDNLDCKLQYSIFDAAVNLGVKQAIKLLQIASGFKGGDVDGKFGPKTMVASFSCSKARYGLYRLIRYVNIVDNNPTQIKFLDGWKNRVQKIVENKDL